MCVSELCTSFLHQRTNKMMKIKWPIAGMYSSFRTDKMKRSYTLIFNILTIP